MKNKYLNIIIVIIGALCFSCSLVSKNEKPLPQVKLVTDLGNIILEIEEDKAPITSANFLNYVDKNMYANTSFYRVVTMNNQPKDSIKIEVIQGGFGFNTEKQEFPPIKHETTKETGILHKNGVISMARLEPGTASSEFFICIGDQPELDYGGMRNPDGQGFAAFGSVIKGKDVVQKIQEQVENGQMLLRPVKILNISRI